MKIGEKNTLPKWKTQVCPLISERHSRMAATELHRNTCLGPDCALWVTLEKTGGNPAYEMVFEGCGLISSIPWAIREDVQGASKL